MQRDEEFWLRDTTLFSEESASAYQLRICDKSQIYIDFPLVTEEAGFPLMQKSSRPNEYKQGDLGPISRLLKQET